MSIITDEEREYIANDVHVVNEVFKSMLNESKYNLQAKARRIVTEYFNSHTDVTNGVQISLSDVYIVWFSKTLQNWKALVSTTVADGKYYELTYDGDRNRTYVDVYVKLDNVTVDD